MSKQKKATKSDQHSLNTVQDSVEGFSNHLLQVKIDRSLYVRLSLMSAYYKKSVQALVVDWLSERAEKEIQDNKDSIGKLLNF